MKKSTILIVDDNKINRLLLFHAFENEGYKLLEADSGYEALEMLKNNDVDLIMLDVMMPGMDGFETCKKIKNNPKAHDIPIIFVTALNDKDSKLRGLQVGAVDFVSKPFDTFEIRLRVKQNLNMRQLYTAIRRQNDKVQKDLLIARQVQMGLLPENNIDFSPQIHFSFEYVPCDSLGGDFLDYIKVDEDHYFFYLTDVSGHGVPSALVTMFAKQFFKSFISNHKEVLPNEAISELNSAMVKSNFSDRYLTIFVGLLNVKNRKLKWASAGPNTPPILIKKDGVEILDNESLAVGWIPEIKWEGKEIVLPEDSTLLMYSDAAIEVKDDADNQLGLDNFKEMVINSEFKKYREFEELIHLLLDYSDEISFQDDLTFVALTCD